MKNRYPNLFVVGAMKAGTTTVHQVLAAHPEIFMSRVKEPKFFAFQHDRTAFHGPADPGNRRAFVDQRRYLSLFEERRNERYAGESSTIYLYRHEAAGNIYTTVPNARIVIILREPVERAYSNYLYARLSGHEREASFRGGVSLEEERIAAGWGPLWHYKHKGRYLGQVERYLRIFPPEQVFVGLFDDLLTRPTEFYRGILDFLELDDYPLPIGTMENRSYQPRFRALQQIFNLRRRLPAALSWAMRSGVMGRFLRYAGELLVRWNSLQSPRLSQMDRDWLQPYFETEWDRLEELLGCSLESWRRETS